MNNNNIAVQITKKHYTRSKVVENHTKPFYVCRLTSRSADDDTKWADIGLFDSKLGITLNEPALRALHARITEVLEGR